MQWRKRTAAGSIVLLLSLPMLLAVAAAWAAGPNPQKAAGAGITRAAPVGSVPAAKKPETGPAPQRRLLPDLVVERIDLTEDCHVSVTVKNQGPGPVPDEVWTTRSTNSAGVYIHGYGGGVIYDFDRARSLQRPGGTATYVSTLKVTAAQDVAAQVDATGKVTEGNEGNNTRTARLTPHCGTRLPVVREGSDLTAGAAPPRGAGHSQQTLPGQAAGRMPTPAGGPAAPSVEGEARPAPPETAISAKGIATVQQVPGQPKPAPKDPLQTGEAMENPLPPEGGAAQSGNAMSQSPAGTVVIVGAASDFDTGDDSRRGVSCPGVRVVDQWLEAADPAQPPFIVRWTVEPADNDCDHWTIELRCDSGTAYVLINPASRLAAARDAAGAYRAAIDGRFFEEQHLDPPGHCDPSPRVVPGNLLPP